MDRTFYKINEKRLSLDQKIEVVRYYYRNGENGKGTARALSLVFGDTFQGCLFENSKIAVR